jgi:hypothetical protein
VRAPQERRSLNDIVDAALKVIDPPAADREEWRAKVAFHIEYLEGIPREHLRTRDIKKNLAAYEKALRAARKVSLSLWQIIQQGEFIKQVDKQIAVVERYKGTRWVKDDGAKPFDLDAEAAVQAARDLIDERGIKAAISAKGAWHRLSQIIYESITGNSDKNVMHYLRHWKPEGPTDEEIEEMMSTTRVRNDA